jgi:dTDP-4-amino-4,6-dideoxygalactose transaminase
MDQQSIFQYGDISVCSMHAYKVFSSVEGGFLTTNDDVLAERIYQLRYFGLSKQNEYVRIGLNGKTSDMHAAYGLANLPYISSAAQRRKEIYQGYLDKLPGDVLRFQYISESVHSNFSYFPVVFPNALKREKVQLALEREGVGSKRYFFPSLNRIALFGDESDMPHAERLADCILCLPFYTSLTDQQVERISEIVSSALT